MKKIILRSSSLQKLLHEFLIPLIPERNDYEVKIECADKKLRFGDFEKTLIIETNSDWLVQIKVGSLRNLFSVIRTIGDQPLVITFENSSGWIQIDNLYI